MVKHWLPEGYEFLSNLILPFVVGAEELWRAHKNARGAREEGEDACVFPPSQACGGIFELRMESVWQSGYECFFKCSGIFRGSLFITRLRRMFYHLVSVFKNKTKKQVNL